MKFSREEFDGFLKSKLDVVIPENNENVLIQRAKLLGFENIILLSTDFNYVKKFQSLKSSNIVPEGINIFFGILIEKSNDLNKCKDFDFTFAYASRESFETKVDFIIDLEYSEKRDSFHYKNTSFNHVHAKLSKDNNHTLIFSFNTLIENPMIFSRIIYNSKIANKYDCNFKVFSLANSETKLCSRSILDSLEIFLKTNH